MKPFFLPALEKYAAQLEDDDTVYIGAIPAIADATSSKLVRKGWWHTLFIAEDTYAQYGLRIMPEKPWQEWPLVVNVGQYACFTIGQEARLYLPFIVNEAVLQTKSLLKGFCEEWDIFLEKGRPVHEIMEGDEEALDKLHAFLGDKKNTDGKMKKEAFYVHFNELFDSKGQFARMIEAVTNMMKKKPYLPDPEAADFDLWESRVMNMAGTKAYLDTKPKDVERAAAILLRAFETPSCYDPCDAGFSILPDRGTEGAAPAMRIAGALQRPEIAELEQVASHVLFPAAQALAEKGKDAYAGVEHMEAAALFDDKMKRPLASWNALVSTAYWSGKNLDQTMLPALEAAIHLCRKHKWKDAGTALNYQLSFFK